MKKQHKLIPLKGASKLILGNSNIFPFEISQKEQLHKLFSDTANLKITKTQQKLKKYEDTTYNISKLVTKNYSTSFYSASLLFKPKIRKAIFSIYGFVRFADEIVDTFHEYNQEELLNKFERDFKNDLKIGLSLNPVLHSFILVIKKYDIDIKLIDAFLSSMRSDLTISDYHTKTELDNYIYGSADVVGLMCLKVFCYKKPEKYNDLKKYAAKLGSAFQKVNFLRDLNEDIFNLSRSYFPQIQQNKLNEETKKQIIEDIQTDFAEAKKGILKLPKEAKTAVYIAYLYYWALLKKIKKTPANQILKKRVRVPNFVKILISIKGIFVTKFNLLK